MKPPTKYWFPAKRYGWGWGLPVTWQGWFVLLIYLALLMVVCERAPPALYPLHFIIAVVLLNAALVAICWLKGEPPGWRWGK